MGTVSRNYPESWDPDVSLPNPVASLHRGDVPF